MTDYDDAHLHRSLAEDVTIAEQGIDVSTEDGRIVLRGDVESEQRRTAIEARARADHPDRTIVNHIRVCAADPPREAEAVQ